MCKLASTVELDCYNSHSGNQLYELGELPEQHSNSGATEPFLRQEEEQMNTLSLSREEFTMCMISIVVLSVALVVQLF